MATQRRFGNDGIMAIHSLHSEEPVPQRSRRRRAMPVAATTESEVTFTN